LLSFSASLLALAACAGTQVAALGLHRLFAGADLGGLHHLTALVANFQLHCFTSFRLGSPVCFSAITRPAAGQRRLRQASRSSTAPCGPAVRLCTVISMPHWGQRMHITSFPVALLQPQGSP